MDYNFHTHTYLCSHATGTPEEYVLYAIKNGIKYMGFSDHMPLKFSDGSESNFRVSTEKSKIYYDEISRLKEKYKQEIDIKIGFEMEYYEDMFDEMLQNAISYGAEYLILGQHYTKAENHPDAVFSYSPHTDYGYLKQYVECVVNAIKTGAFSYIGHPDFFNFIGGVSVYKKEMRKICEASARYAVPLEINFLGIRDNRIYPNEAFWEEAGRTKAPVTFGLDAHSADRAYDINSLKRAKELVEKFDLNYIGKPRIVNIRNLK